MEIGSAGKCFRLPWQEPCPSARDPKRMADIRQIKTAMELYYDDSEAYLTRAAMAPAIGAYLSRVPTDPKSEADYGWIDNTGDDQKFCVYAELETKEAYFAASHKGTKELTSVPTSTDCW